MNANRIRAGRGRLVALGAGIAVIAAAGVAVAREGAEPTESVTAHADAAVGDVALSATQPDAPAAGPEATADEHPTVIEYVPQTGVPVTEADAEPLRPIAAELDMQIERLGAERGEFDLGFIDGNFLDPITGTFVTFTVDPNARGIPWEWGFENYERQDVDGAIFLTKDDNPWTYSVVAQNADGSTVISMIVSRHEGDGETYSRDVKDRAVQLLLPALLAVRDQ